MIPYDQLCMALDRYNAKRRGDEVAADDVLGEGESASVIDDYGELAIVETATEEAGYSVESSDLLTDESESIAELEPADAALVEDGVGYATPDAYAASADDGGLVPTATTEEPTPAGSHPDAAGSYPNAASSQPDAAGSYPNAASSQPDAAGSYPNAASSQPDAAGSYPNAASSQPDAAGSYPNAAGSSPDGAGSYPDAAGSNPDGADPNDPTGTPSKS